MTTPAAEKDATAWSGNDPLVHPLFVEDFLSLHS